MHYSGQAAIPLPPWTRSPRTRRASSTGPSTVDMALRGCSTLQSQRSDAHPPLSLSRWTLLDHTLAPIGGLTLCPVLGAECRQRISSRSLFGLSSKPSFVVDKIVARCPINPRRFHSVRVRLTFSRAFDAYHRSLSWRTNGSCLRLPPGRTFALQL